MSLVEPTSRIDQERPAGEVFTRRWIVEMMLDLAGYTVDVDLASMRAVEPACGAGAFLRPMVERLSNSCRSHGRPITDARQALVALDLDLDNVNQSRRVVHDTLVDGGWTPRDASSLARTWVMHADYLLEGPPRLTLVDEGITDGADFVIGNPPYIRPEDVPNDLYQAYRSSWPTMTGRADVYVGFFEAGLRSLRPGGVLTFICADRWMRNQYGRELRSLISGGYAMQALITMHDVDAFETPVSAYPAITVIRRGAQADVAIADATADFAEDDGRKLVTWALGNRHHIKAVSFEGTRLGHWFAGGESWPGGDPKTIEMVESLNTRFAPIEDPGTGTKVGIGIATGNDRLFVTKDPDLVEHERLLPLAVSADGASGTLRWSGHFLVNPWEADGSLVDLATYPRLRQYLELHGAELGRRHVAKRSAANWYRTIDKVSSPLAGTPKLLFPDMKMTIHPVLDSGTLYPHHNLYWITSEKWDLEVLGGLLMSRVAEAFVSAYCVKMRGGTLRFQAQYLRRIRVPRPDDISADDRAALAAAFSARDADAATEIAIRIYGVDEYRDVLRAS